MNGRLRALCTGCATVATSVLPDRIGFPVGSDALQTRWGYVLVTPQACDVAHRAIAAGKIFTGPALRTACERSRVRAWGRPILENPEQNGVAGPEHGAAASASPGRSARELLCGPGAFAVWLATAGGVGFAPAAPGTFGSLFAVAGFCWLQPTQLAPYLLGTAVVSVVGVVASGAAGRATGVVDDGRFVIDEVAGQLIALAPVVAISGPLAFVLTRGVFISLVVTAFVAFRVFDIAKPGPVGWAERRFAGGLGVMADDWVAGVLAAAAVAGLIAAFVAFGSLSGGGA